MHFDRIDADGWASIPAEVVKQDRDDSVYLGASLPQALKFRLDKLCFSRRTEEFLLRVLQVLTEQPQGKQPITGLYRVAWKRVDVRDDTIGR